MYLPGDTVLITDIGVFTSVTADGAGSSLVCVTSNVNIQCCRGINNPNGGALGEWHFPDGTIVPRYSADLDADFSRSGFTHQVRLNRRNNAIGPTGAYECRVPPLGGGALVTASITIGERSKAHTKAPAATCSRSIFFSVHIICFQVL